MLVERYSFHGFDPQKQTHHLAVLVYPHLYEWKKVFAETPEFMKSSVLERHKKLAKFYRKNLHDFTEGVWVFPYGHKTNRSLNHTREKRPVWLAELPDDTVVYDVNWECQMLLDNPRCELFGCYVPKRSLEHISNICLKRDYQRKEVI